MKWPLYVGTADKVYPKWHYWFTKKENGEDILKWRQIILEISYLSILTIV